MKDCLCNPRARIGLGVFGFFGAAAITATMVLIFSSATHTQLFAAVAAWPTDDQWYVVTSNGDAAIDESAIAGCTDPTTGANPAGENDIASQSVCQSSPSYNPGNLQPGATIRNTYSNGFYYMDQNGDSDGCTNLSDDYVQYRTRVAGNPIGLTKKGFVNSIWFVRLDGNGDGVEDFYIRLDGNGDLAAELLDVIYETTGDDDPTGEPIVASFSDPITLQMARGILTPDNGIVGDNTEYFVDFQVPMTAFKDNLGNQVLCHGDPMITANYSTSATASDPDQKDYILGAGVFSDVITFAEPDYQVTRTMVGPVDGVATVNDPVEYVVTATNLSGNMTSLTFTELLDPAATFIPDSYGAGTGIQITYRSSVTGDVATYNLTNGVDTESSCSDCSGDYHGTLADAVTVSNDWLYATESSGPLYDIVEIRYKVSYASPGDYDTQGEVVTSEISETYFTDDPAVDDGADCTDLSGYNCNDGNTANDDLNELTILNTPNFSTSTLTEGDVDNIVVPGDTVSYTLTLINSGSITGTGVSVDSTIDLDTENLTNIVVNNCGSSYTDNSTTTDLAITDLVVTTSTDCVITYDVTVENPSDEDTPLDATATISSATEGGPGGTPSADTVTVDVTPNLAVTTTDNDVDNDVAKEAIVTFTVTVSNTGDGTGTGILVTDTLDADLENINVTSVTNCGSSYTDTSAGNSLNIADLEVAVGTDCEIVYTAQVDAAAAVGATIPTSVTVGAPLEGGSGTSALGDTLTVVAGSADVGLVFVADNTSVQEDETINLTLTATNNGPNATSLLNVNYDVPTGLTYVSSTPSHGTYDSGSGIWTIGALAPGDSVNLQIQVTTDAGTAGTSLVNTATVEDANPPDNNTTNDTVNLIVSVYTISSGEDKVSVKDPAIKSDECTPDREIELTLEATNATEVIVSEEDPQFIGVTWESFTNPSQKLWMLAPGDGWRTFFARFRSNTGNLSSVVSTQVYLDQTNQCTDEEEIEEPPEPPEIPVETCAVTCDEFTYDLYIVNPDGTERHMDSFWAKDNAIGYKTRRVSFEDKGEDFDYNDVVIDINRQDCSNVTFEFVGGSSRWHHQVYATVYYQGVEKKDVLLWQDSTAGFGSTVSFDAIAEANICAPDTVHVAVTAEEAGVCQVVCSELSYDAFIVNPDGSERHMNSNYTQVENLSPGVTRVNFEDKGDDFDYNDVIITISQLDCENIIIDVSEGDALWEHQIYFRILHQGQEVDVELWENSQLALTGLDRYRFIDTGDYLCPADQRRVFVESVEDIEDREQEESEANETDLPSSSDENLGAFIYTEGQVTDTLATRSSFKTNLQNREEDFYVGGTLTFLSGPLKGESRTILSYDPVTKRIFLDPELPLVPSFGDVFEIVTQSLTVELPDLGEVTPEDIIDIEEEAVLNLYAELVELNKILDKVNQTALLQGEIEDLASQNVIVKAESARIRRIFEELGLVEINDLTLDKLLQLENEDFQNEAQLKKQIANLRALSSMLRRILETRAGTPVVESYMTFGSLELNFVAANPLEIEQRVIFKTFLPEEVGPGNIFSTDGLNLEQAGDAWFLSSNELVLGPHEVVVRTVTMDDIWNIDNSSLDNLLTQASGIAATLVGTRYEAQSRLLQGGVELAVALIKQRQLQEASTPQHHIALFRRNSNEIDRANQDLERLKDFVQTTIEIYQQEQALRILRMLILLVTLFILLVVLVFMVLNRHVIHRKYRQAEKKRGKTKRDGKKKKSNRIEKRSSAKKIDWAVWKYLMTHNKVVMITLGVSVALFIILFAKMQLTQLLLYRASVENEQVAGELIDSYGDDEVLEKVVQFDEEYSGPMGPVEPIEPTQETVPVVPPLPLEPRLIITDTPTGTLNVRDQGSLAGAIIKKAVPGEEYEWVAEEDSWYQIRLDETGQVGWVFGDYVSIISE